MDHATASPAKSLDLVADHSLTLIDRLEDMSRVVPVLTVLEAGEAQVKVWAMLASDELCS